MISSSSGILPEAVNDRCRLQEKAKPSGQIPICRVCPQDVTICPRQSECLPTTGSEDGVAEVVDVRGARAERCNKAISNRRQRILATATPAGNDMGSCQLFRQWFAQLRHEL
jgi:hypothetical protein